ncbi:M15 family metallopeptidase [Nostoc sp. UHCC 0870]|uniref:M15 family metallopeptidase n=1 Tax=Nostoc sp. UHCC 0870 TaxID=2914041 RepID=UPI001EDCD0AA|nr:M15 family metallopeptidase [Nostoc sp. UHCC 0870]UKO97788.1 M15 family metallopeptidase [Nostoc sp. UHCC 0870]
MKPKKKRFYLLRLLGIATIALFTVVIFGVLLLKFSLTNPSGQATTYSTPSNIVTPKVNSMKSALPSVEISTNSTSITVDNLPPVNQQPITTQIAYGHFPYSQADPKQLIIVGSYASGIDQRFEFLNPEACQAFMKMIYAARDAGVWIIPVSGFRSIEKQQKLFQNQIQRYGSAQAAAKISAPPGYSEHHTGFAVDLTDGKFPKQDITLAFKKTDAYRWLTRNAKKFGFEMSFPANNLQGVNFEPWHWRYVGSSNAAAIFTNARN